MRLDSINKINLLKCKSSHESLSLLSEIIMQFILKKSDLNYTALYINLF